MIGGNDDTRLGEGRAMRCEEARVLLMGYLDGELDPMQVSRLEDHLAVCVACRREKLAFRRLGEVTEQMASEEVPGSEIQAAWDSIYRRLERAVGWILLSIGLMILTGYGLWELLHGFLLNPEEPLLARVGTGAAVAGLVVLLVSIGRERWITYRSERYREVQR